MGTHPSKLNRVVSRSTTDTTSSLKDKKEDSQLTGQTPTTNETGAALHSAATSESRTTSKSNLSSFLNGLKNKASDADQGVTSGDKSKAEEDRRLEDLREQELQKKINKRNEKEKKAAKQQLKLQQSRIPYQQHSAASTWSTLVDSPSPLPSTHSLPASSPPLPSSEQQLRRTLSGKSRCSNRIFSASTTASTPSPSAVQSSMKALPNTDADATADSTAKIPPLVAQASHSKSSAFAPQQTPPQKNKRKSVKPSFIRGKAGFAWLEKRMPPASSGMDEEVLNDNSWSYLQGQLEAMEIEAAKGYVDRVTDQHYLMKDIMGGNYYAPLDLAFKRVLENGCGAGDWTLDMASEMPETDFVGCPQIMFTTSNAENNMPILPRPRGLLGADQSQQGSIPSSTSSPGSVATLGNTSSTSISTAVTASSVKSTNESTPSGSTTRPSLRPRNCVFHPEVPLNRLPFQNDHFDFVYQRRQGVVLLSTEWQRTILELFRVIKRGGWVEILEPDLAIHGGGELCKLAGEYFIGIFGAMGRNLNVVHEMQHLLENAGFVNVSVKVFSIPLGWGGVIGQAMLVNQRQFVNEMEPIYVRQGLGLSEDYRELAKDIFEEAVEKKGYINYHVAVGQKPASASERAMHQQHRLHQQDEIDELMRQHNLTPQHDGPLNDTHPPMLVPQFEP